MPSLHFTSFEPRATFLRRTFGTLVGFVWQTEWLENLMTGWR